MSDVKTSQIPGPAYTWAGASFAWSDVSGSKTWAEAYPFQHGLLAREVLRVIGTGRMLIIEARSASFEAAEKSTYRQVYLNGEVVHVATRGMSLTSVSPIGAVLHHDSYDIHTDPAGEGDRLIADIHAQPQGSILVFNTDDQPSYIYDPTTLGYVLRDELAKLGFAKLDGWEHRCAWAGICIKGGSALDENYVGAGEVTMASSAIPIAPLSPVFAARFNNSLQGNVPERIRYIRDWINESTVNNGDHWVEIQAYNGSTNVAAGATVTASHPPNAGTLAMVTDGNTASANYVGLNAGEPCWVQVDLGDAHELAQIKVWHYYADGRTYHKTKTEVSEDGIAWYRIFDSAIEGEYVETADGKTHDLSNLGLTAAPSAVTDVSLNHLGTGVYNDEDSTNLINSITPSFVDFTGNASITTVEDPNCDTPMQRIESTDGLITSPIWWQAAGTLTSLEPYTYTLDVRGVGRARLYLHQVDNGAGGDTGQGGEWATLNPHEWQRIEISARLTETKNTQNFLVQLDEGAGSYVEVTKPQCEHGWFATSFINGADTARGSSLLSYDGLALGDFTIHVRFVPGCEYYKTETVGYNRVLLRMWDASFERRIDYTDYINEPSPDRIDSAPFFNLEPNVNWDGIMHHWHHSLTYKKGEVHDFIIRKTSSNLRINIYREGELVKEQGYNYTDSTKLADFVLTRLDIGNGGAYDDNWQGIVKSVQVYDSRLSDADMERIIVADELLARDLALPKSEALTLADNAAKHTALPKWESFATTDSYGRLLDYRRQFDEFLSVKRGGVSELALDGYDDYVAIRDFKYEGGGHTKLTVEAIIKTTKDLSEIASFDRSEYWRFMIGSDITGARGTIGMAIYTNTGQKDVTGIARVDDGLEHHVAAVFDGLLETLSFYVDGELDKQYTGIGSSFGYGLRYGFVGVGSEAASYDGTKGPFHYQHGTIREFRIWDEVRTQDQIRRNMSARLPADDRAGLQLYYPFDEGYGAVAYDHSGNQYHGDLKNGAGWSTSGEAKSTEFVVVDNRVVIPNNPSIQITGDQAIEMWLKPYPSTVRRNPFNKSYGGEGTITLELDNGMNYFWGTAGVNTQPYQAVKSPALRINEWNHVFLVRDLTNGIIWWNVNGNTTSSAPAYAEAVASESDLSIGHGYTSSFDGLIAGVRLYNRALSGAEIEERRRGIYSDLSGEVLHLPLNELSGNIAHDHSGTGNDGTIVAPVRVYDAPPSRELRSAIDLPKSEYIAISENYADAISYIRGFAETVGFSESYADVIGFMVAVSESISVGEHLGRDAQLGAFQETLSLAESVGKSTGKSVAESVAVGEAFGRVVGFYRELLESLQMHYRGSNGALLINDGGAVEFANSDLINTASAGYTNKTHEARFTTGSDVTSRQVIWEQGGGSNGLNLYVGDGKLWVGAWSDSAPTPFSVFLSVEIEPSAECHAAISFEENGDVIGYLNGVEFARQAVSSYLYRHIGSVAIGAVRFDTRFHDGDISGSGYVFRGLIGEQRHWNVTRTAQQVANHMDAELTGAESGLVGWWRADDLLGTTLTDYSGSNLHGSIVNGEWVMELEKSTALAKREYAQFLDGLKRDSGKSIAESLAVADTLGRTVAFKRALAEGLSVDDALAKATELPFTEAFDTFEQYRRNANGVISDVLVDTGDLTEFDFEQLLRYQSAVGYERFRSFIPGDYDYQDALFKTVLVSLNEDRPHVDKLNVEVDVPDVFDRGRADIAVGGATIDFNRNFNVPPEVQVTLKGGTVVATPKIIDITKTGFTVQLEDGAGGTVAGTVTWAAEGY